MGAAFSDYADDSSDDEDDDLMGGGLNPSQSGLGLHNNMSNDDVDQWGGSPLAAAAGQGDHLTQGLDLLSGAPPTTGAPPDPLASFKQLMLQWQPLSDDREYADANRQLKTAISGANDIVARNKKRNDMSLLSFGAAMMAPSKTGSFTESLSNAIPAYVKAKQGSEGREDDLDQFLSKLQVAGHTSLAQLALQKGAKADTAYNGRLMAAAALARTQTLANRPGAQSDLEKFYRGQGGDPTSPEGKIQMKRLYYMRAGTPQIRNALMRNPGMDPDSPDFQKELTTEFDREIQKKSLEAERTKSQINNTNSEKDARDEKLARDKATISPDAKLAEQYGVPFLDTDPYAGLGNDSRERAYQTNEKAKNKHLEEMQKQLDVGQSVSAKYDQALALLDRGLQTNPKYRLGFNTRGPRVDGVQMPGGGVNAGSVAKFFNGDLDEFNTLAKGVAPSLRQAGSGSMSDRDQAILEEGNIGIDKRPTTNRNIIMTYKALQQRNVDKMAAMDQYFQANKTMAGFAQRWAEYYNAVPLIDYSEYGKTKEIKPNPNYKSFSDWWRSKRKQ